MTDAGGFDVGFNASGSRDFRDLPRVIRRRIRRILSRLRRDPRAEPAILMWGEWEGYWRRQLGVRRRSQKAAASRSLLNLGIVLHLIADLLSAAATTDARR